MMRLAAEVLHGNKEKLNVEDYAILYGLDDSETKILYETLNDLDVDDFCAALTSRNARKWIRRQDRF